jgi:hypothetical protein
MGSEDYIGAIVLGIVFLVFLMLLFRGIDWIFKKRK